MSLPSLAYQQSVFKRFYSNQHYSEVYLQDGGENQLEWNYATETLCILHQTKPDN